MIRRGNAVLQANIAEAARSLILARQRTALGIVGISVGIGSIIAMISVGLIAKAEALREFEGLGTDLLVVHSVRSSSGAPARGISPADAMALSWETATIRAASPRLLSTMPVAFAGANIGRRQVNGVSERFADILRLELSGGRFVSDLDDLSFYSVVGSEVAQAMQRAGAGQVVGEVIKLNRQRYTVVGALAEAPERSVLSLDINPNRSIFIPLKNAQRVFPWQDVRMVAARSGRGVHHEAATSDIVSYFKGRDRLLKVSVDSATVLIEQMESQMQILTLLLGAVGSIALIVGGIGIMNIMVASIGERKTEIGLRRALGARRNDIQGQFLIESVALCLLGGLLGTVIGVVSTYAICQFADWGFSVSRLSVALGLGVSSITGVFFGFQPARQAARLDPINALHAP